MAQIDVERKKGGAPILPIALGLLALVAIIAAVLLFTRGDDRTAGTVPGALPQDTVGDGWGTAAGPGAAADVPQEVRAFREQCADASQFRDEMALEHQHEADCMRRLADGMDAVIRRDQVAGQPMDQRVQALRQRADQITQDPQATDHANRVRGAALEAAEIIEYMAQQRTAVGANLQQQAQQVREAANRIDAGTLLLQQQDRTSRFFATAADALEAMDRSRQQQPR